MTSTFLAVKKVEAAGRSLFSQLINASTIENIYAKSENIYVSSENNKCKCYY